MTPLVASIRQAFLSNYFLSSITKQGKMLCRVANKRDWKQNSSLIHSRYNRTPIQAKST
ncbi:hypothetical protein AT1219_170033 [Vibrio alginolyticus]